AIIDRAVGSYRGLEENSRLDLLDGHESGIGLATSIWIPLWHLRYSRWQRRFDLEIPIRMFASTSVIGTGVSRNITKRGSVNKAQRPRATAERYIQCSGPWRGPPHAAAMAMPVPRRRTFTQAIGWRTGKRQPPDDAA